MKRYEDKPDKGHFYGLQGVMSFTGEIAKSTLIGGEDFPVATIGSHSGKWSDRSDQPHGLVQIGDMVEMTFNQLGCGRVCAFFVEDGFLGVQVEYLSRKQRPDWHIKANGDKHPEPLVFGSEIRVIRRADPNPKTLEECCKIKESK